MSERCEEEMKIALMTNNYKPIVAGVPISIERLARGVEELGHEVTVFAPTYKEQQDMENVFRYSTCLNHFIGGIVLPNPFDARIEREFKEHSYDIIHVHHPMLIGRMAVHLSRKYHIPLVFTYHTRYEQYVRSYTKGIVRMNRFMPLYLRSFMRHCNFVFAPTEGMQKYLTDTCRIRPEKTGILPTGIEKENFDIEPEEGRRIRRQYGAENMPFLLTVSRMANEKNVRFLLDSLARVKELYGKPFRMLMVGDGPDREGLEKHSRELGLEDTVIFAGTVRNEEIAPYFKAADAFLFASKTETQGIVVLEAFAGAAPVIAVRASGVEDLVDDGINGILTEEDTQEYAQAVAEYLAETDNCTVNKDIACEDRKSRAAEGDTACKEAGIAEGDTACKEAGIAEGNTMCEETHMAVGNTVCEETQSHMDMNAVWKIEGRKSADGVLEHGIYRKLPYAEMAENAFQKGTLYREEAVALKAVHYYNSVIAENVTQKKRNIRLLPAG